MFVYSLIYTNEISAEDLPHKDSMRLINLCLVAIPDGMKVVVGVEVYVTRYMFNGDDFSCACYGNSNYILRVCLHIASFQVTPWSIL